MFEDVGFDSGDIYYTYYMESKKGGKDHQY